VKITGKKHWLWRAVDQDGMVLDILVQSWRDKGVVNLTAGGQRSALRTALCHAIAGTPATSHHVRKAVSRAWRCSVADRR
jgi:hypothetical protein